MIRHLWRPVRFHSRSCYDTRIRILLVVTLLRNSAALLASCSAGRRNALAAHALTERQLQFWEDVDDGLNEIEAYYVKRGQNIDRVRQFSKSARGELLPPTGSSPGHEPSGEHVYGLTARPFWDARAQADRFPWAQKLEENALVIQHEFDNKLADADKFASDSVFQSQVMGNGWAAIRLQRLGVWNTDNCNEFPQTHALLRSLKIPLAVRGVCFARQAPYTGVKPHSDGRNFILTSHLGLKIPDGCWIEVGGEKRQWQEGKLTTLDTSFTHSTSNPSDEDRYVLIIDFWHPELTVAERAGLEFVYDLRNKFESGQVPYKKPRSLQEESGFGKLWQSLTGGGKP